MSKNLMVTGTGTDVGKTYVAALMVKKLASSGLRAGYFKAAMSGNERRTDGSLIPGDARHVKEISGIGQPLEEMCPYVYEQAVSPHLAARMEGNPVRLDRVLHHFKALGRAYDYLTVEGSGGILCPLRYDEEKIFLPDMIRACQLSCLVVADAGLGAINAVGLTVFYMKERGIPLKGIVLNRFQPGNPMHEDNRLLCEHLTGVRVVACVQDGDTELDISPALLQSLYE